MALILVTAPLWILSRLEAILRGGETVFSAFADLLSLLPGPPGVFLRRAYYIMTLSSCSRDLGTAFGTSFSHRQVIIGRRVSIGKHCTLGMVDIGEDAIIGSNVDILSGRRQHHFDSSERPVHEQGGRFEQVRIGKNTWIGNSAVIMADVGTNSVVGAGSVVVQAAGDWVVVAGNPAHVIRTLERKTLAECDTSNLNSVAR